MLHHVARSPAMPDPLDTRATFARSTKNKGRETTYLVLGDSVVPGSDQSRVIPDLGLAELGGSFRRVVPRFGLFVLGHFDSVFRNVECCSVSIQSNVGLTRDQVLLLNGSSSQSNTPSPEM